MNIIWKEAILTNYQNHIFLFNLSVNLSLPILLYEIENKLAGSLSYNLSSWLQLTDYYAFHLEQEENSIGMLCWKVIFRPVSSLSTLSHYSSDWNTCLRLYVTWLFIPKSLIIVKLSLSVQDSYCFVEYRLTKVFCARRM